MSLFSFQAVLGVRTKHFTNQGNAQSAQEPHSDCLSHQAVKDLVQKVLHTSLETSFIAAIEALKAETATESQRKRLSSIISSSLGLWGRGHFLDEFNVQRGISVVELLGAIGPAARWACKPIRRFLARSDLGDEFIIPGMRILERCGGAQAVAPLARSAASGVLRVEERKLTLRLCEEAASPEAREVVRTTFSKAIARAPAYGGGFAIPKNADAAGALVEACVTHKDRTAILFLTNLLGHHNLFVANNAAHQLERCLHEGWDIAPQLLHYLDSASPACGKCRALNLARHAEFPTDLAAPIALEMLSSESSIHQHDVLLIFEAIAVVTHRDGALLTQNLKQRIIESLITGSPEVQRRMIAIGSALKRHARFLEPTARRLAQTNQIHSTNRDDLDSLIHYFEAPAFKGAS